jgi:hypothetical protein
LKPNTDASNLQLIQENMYNLYKLTPQELDSLLGQTYHRKESDHKVESDPDWWLSESYACVVRVKEEDAKRLHNKQYNELELSFDNDYEHPLQLTVHSCAGNSWTAYLPYPPEKIEPPDLSLLWSSIIELLTPRATNDCDCWLCFTHRYFLQITKELGVTEYDYG